MKNKIFLLFLIIISACNQHSQYDIIISQGNVYDGSGNSPSILDIGIIGSNIVEIGNLNNAYAKRVIDAKQLSVSPGFIDVHAHLDPIMKLSYCESHLRQGVTTSIGGPDGSSPWTLGKYLDSLAQIGIGMNVGYLIGHNTVRKNIMALENRAPTPEELSKMKSQISQGMKEGAFGISTGLKYLPGNFSKIDEVISLSKVASDQGGVYTSHLRDEGLEVLSSVREAIEISKKAEMPVVLTHHKVIGKPMWGESAKTLALVDSARASGLDILIDQYPYNASYTGISVLIPTWARAGGNKEFAKRVSNPILKDSIKKGIIFNILNDRGGNDLSRVQFAKVNWMPELEGKTLKDWSEIKGLESTIENGAELVIEAQLNGGASCVFFAMDEKDVENIMKHPKTMIASDGRLVKPGQGHPHPRWYGTFPRVLGHYVREKKILSLSEAIYKMTLLPAKTMGLKNRGEIKVGMKADLAIFDADKIIDKSTFNSPHQYPEGIYFVIVNGQIAIDNNQFMNIKSGEVLRYN
ncbi:MAG: aminoacylase [Flavobacteriaceae bacterium]|nr:aminoacylase [Flavobacteriaceae bacterium]